MTDGSAHKVLLFDLGGIFMRLRDPAETFGLDTTVDDFNRDWLNSAAVRKFERGGVATEDFAQQVIQEIDFDCDAEEFIRRFDRWPHSLYPGAIDLLEQLSEAHSCAILSNTNALHWGREDIGPVIGDVVDKAFLSFETGRVKPDDDAYLQVVEHYACEPQKVLFIDDNPINTDAAAAVGMRSRLCSGLAAVKRALVDERITTASEL